MAAVFAARLFAAGRRDVATVDRHALAVGTAPIPVDRVGARYIAGRDERDNSRSGAHYADPSAFHVIDPRFQIDNAPLKRQ